MLISYNWKLRDKQKQVFISMPAKIKRKIIGSKQYKKLR